MHSSNPETTPGGVDFTYTPQPTRVIFATGSLARLADEVTELGAKRALVLCSPGQQALAQRAETVLGNLSAGRYPHAVMHVPIEVARQARDQARAAGADCIVAIGGGSTIGLGKAIALESPLPIIAVPTTYAGSEMTPIYGLTEGGRKRTGRSADVLPRTVIYDPALSAGLPTDIAVASGINAIAHAAEALYARDANPVSSLLAEEGIGAIARGLRRLVQAPAHAQARSDCLYGAWLCGTVLGQVGMALHHKLCHTLGGSFNLPHAQTHTIVLPHALAYNRAAAPEAMRRIARALGADDAATGLHDLITELGAPTALRDIGLAEADVITARDIAMGNPYWNPRPLEADAILALLQDAWRGARPAA